MTIKDKIPATRALLLLFWVILGVAVIAGGYVSISGFGDNAKLASGLLIIISGFILASAVRMFANIGQMIFDIKAFLMDNLNKMLSIEIQETRDVVTKKLNNLNGDLKTKMDLLNTNCEQINCDTKDINNNIQKLCLFFEQIEKHLKLKK